MPDDRRLLQVRQWCEQSRIDGLDAELSDDAAVLIAAGRLDEQTRTVLTNRRREGRRIPSVGGFRALRLLTDEFEQYQEKVERLQSGPIQSLIGFRAKTLAKRLQDMRRAVELSSEHYADGVRAIRRDRRLGVHLEPGQRSALFAALQRTPAPVPPGAVDQLRGVATSAADRVARLAVNTPIASVAKRAVETAAGSESDRFADRFDTLLYLAGILFDRIDGSEVWRSEYFAVQRLQLDLADELIQIALDTVALREIESELSAAIDSTRMDDARDRIRTRLQALTPVWDQLLERVAALARIDDLLVNAADQLRSMALAEQTGGLDERIDELIARSGNRELSAANTHFVGDQIGGADRLISSVQLALHDDIAVLTSRG